MVSKKDVEEIIKSFLGSILFFLLISSGILNYLYTIFYGSDNVIVLYLNPYLLTLFTIILILSIVYFFVSYSRMDIHNGREDAMKANSKLLKINEPKDRAKRHILSTRISFWPLTESSSARAEFRNLLTQKIENNIEVKRIWQIWCEDDLDSLDLYLKRYKDHDNLSIKYFIGDSLLPEILSVYGKVVSVSITQPSDPIKLTTAFHFYGKKEILRWESYFRVLWDSATPIKIANKIYYRKIERLKDELREVKSALENS